MLRRGSGACRALLSCTTTPRSLFSRATVQAEEDGVSHDRRGDRTGRSTAEREAANSRSESPIVAAVTPTTGSGVSPPSRRASKRIYVLFGGAYTAEAVEPRTSRSALASCSNGRASEKLPRRNVRQKSLTELIQTVMRGVACPSVSGPSPVVSCASASRRWPLQSFAAAESGSTHESGTWTTASPCICRSRCSCVCDPRQL